MQINILTIFPDFFVSPLGVSIIKRAIEAKIVNINVVNIRDFAQDKHRTTDDRPYGGGPGMVMKIEPIDLALKSLGVEKGQDKGKIILTSAKGQMFTQEISREIASTIEVLTIICGHYEGVDERVAENLIDEESRIGDYVLTGGEIASMVMVDSVVRLIPGVLGNEDSNKNESHSEVGKMGFGQYTRPENYGGLKVPKVLLSGDHGKIEEWRER